jgi:hypothetical protein
MGLFASALLIMLQSSTYSFDYCMLLLLLFSRFQQILIARLYILATPVNTSNKLTQIFTLLFVSINFCEVLLSPSNVRVIEEQAFTRPCNW